MKDKSVLEFLSDLVKIPSVSNVDNTLIIEKIAEWFTDFETQIQEWVRDDGVTGKNLIIKIPGIISEKSLVFVSHMDTVPESSKWETDPFSVIEKEGKLYGLGSCDMKGGAASLIKAVLTLKKKPARDTYLVFSGDEEVSSYGALKLKESSLFSDPEFIFIEPTDNKVLISQRSVFQFDVMTQGLAQHGSYATPSENKNNNAIFKMGLLMPLLMQDANRMAGEKDKLLDSNTQNFGSITGGTARNVMADSCTLEVDRRLLPHINPQEEIKRVSSLLMEVDPTVTVRQKVSHPSFSTIESSPIVQNALNAMKSNGRNEGIGGFQAWSEAGLFSEMGNVIILGPGSIAQAHKANEFIEKKDLCEYVSIFQEIIET